MLDTCTNVKILVILHWFIFAQISKTVKVYADVHLLGVKTDSGGMFQWFPWDEFYICAISAKTESEKLANE